MAKKLVFVSLLLLPGITAPLVDAATFTHSANIDVLRTVQLREEGNLQMAINVPRRNAITLEINPRGKALGRGPEIFDMAALQEGRLNVSAVSPHTVSISVEEEFMSEEELNELVQLTSMKAEYAGAPLELMHGGIPNITFNSNNQLSVGATVKISKMNMALLNEGETKEINKQVNLTVSYD